MVKSIYLLGLKHSGKTTLGKALSSTLGYSWYDGDDILSTRYTEKQNIDPQKYHAQPIPGEFYPRTIMTIHGPDFFSEFEYQALTHFVKNLSNKNFIISFGGGFASNPRAKEFFHNFPGLPVFLDVPEEVLFDRILNTGIPPFLESPSIEESKLLWHKLYQKRRNDALHLSGLILPLNNLGITEAQKVLETSLEEHFYGR